MIIELPDSDILLNELRKLDTELKPHYPESKTSLHQTGALRNINSVFLATNIFPITEKKLENPIRHTAIQLLDSSAKCLGKTVDDIHYAYYAVIPPMSQIYPHVDISPYYDKVNRYQIFFNLTKDQIVTQHGSSATSNSIVWFDPTVTHSFINKSPTEPWRFVVFDIYKTMNG